MNGQVVTDDTYTVRLYGRTAAQRVMPPTAMIEPHVDIPCQRFQRAALRVTYMTIRDYCDASDARQIVLALLNAGRKSEQSFDTWRRHPGRF